MSTQLTRENFDKMVNENPELYDLFKRFAFEAMKYKKSYAAAGILYRIRWETEVSEAGSEYKINQNWARFFAIKFMEEFPQYEGFFRMKNTGSGV